MKLIFSENPWEDYLYWQKTDKKILNRINKLVKAVPSTSLPDHAGPL